MPLVCKLVRRRLTSTRLATMTCDFAPKICSSKAGVLQLGLSYRNLAPKICSSKAAVLQLGLSYRNLTDDLPWDAPSPLTATIPQDCTKLPMFYKVEVFHTCHKGVMADLCANSHAFRFECRGCMSVNSGIDITYEQVVAFLRKSTRYHYIGCS